MSVIYLYTNKLDWYIIRIVDTISGVPFSNCKGLIQNLIAGSGAFVGESGGNGEFVLMNGSNWELVFMDGSDGQMVTLGLESGIIGNPGQSEFLAFGGNPVRRSLVGVSLDFSVRFFAVRVVGFALEFLLGVGFVTGGVVGLGVAAKINNEGAL
jgi:hypothetical protein